jgi:hypothetical protein
MRGYFDHHRPAYNAELVNELRRLGTRIDRMIALVLRYFEYCLPLLEANRVLRYEGLVSSGGKMLTAVTEHAGALTGELRERKGLTESLVGSSDPGRHGRRDDQAQVRGDWAYAE